jgi:hypothetical protein
VRYAPALASRSQVSNHLHWESFTASIDWSSVRVVSLTGRSESRSLPRIRIRIPCLSPARCQPGGGSCCVSLSPYGLSFLPPKQKNRPRGPVAPLALYRSRCPDIICTSSHPPQKCSSLSPEGVLLSDTLSHNSATVKRIIFGFRAWELSRDRDDRVASGGNLGLTPVQVPPSSRNR